MCNKKVVFNIIASTVVKVGSSELASVSPVGGSGAYLAYDCDDIANIDPSNLMCFISFSTFAVQQINMPFEVGLTLIKSGTNPVASVTYV